MSALICGSLAFDTITNFPGRFAQQILPDQVHILNVSFLVPTMRREWGGCAGNIAYTHKLLGGEPVILAALGSDGEDYLVRLRELGIDTSAVLIERDQYTAQCVIITDQDNNQITAFHPGAMSVAHHAAVPTRARRSDLAIGIIAPDGRIAMGEHAHQMHAQGIPFVFDPGQQLPQFDGAEHREILGMARWVAVNDYEARMLSERTGESLSAISRRPNIDGVVVTLAEQGCEVWRQGSRTHVPGSTADTLVDPTGCGDAFRAGLLYALERGWPLESAAALGNRLGAIKIAHRGGQNHRFDAAALTL
ncbi:MAG: carbohydrate kinase family protein [Aquincola sp.]|nr:carbohydrate kinase family protein [Aquincola sp.]MDH5328652.1 carbohydrate kinase family protein [Aquincola sp.]